MRSFVWGGSKIGLIKPRNSIIMSYKACLKLFGRLKENSIYNVHGQIFLVVPNICNVIINFLEDSQYGTPFILTC
jgi:hypothetical protein